MGVKRDKKSKTNRKRMVAMATPHFSWGRVYKFLMLRPVRRLLLTSIIVGVLIWQTRSIISMQATIRYGIASNWNTLLELFGWGLILIGVAIAAVVWLLTADIHSIERRWRHMLAFAVSALAIFGLLAFFWFDDPILRVSTLGGRFGQWIIGAPDAGGVVRVVLLALIGFVLAAPRAVWRSLCATKRGMRRVALAVRRWCGICVEWIKSRRWRRRGKFSPAASDKAPLTRASSERREPLQTPSGKTVSGLSEDVTKKEQGFVPSPAAISPADAWQKLRQSTEKLGDAYQKSAPIDTESGWQLPPVEIMDDPPRVELSEVDVEQRARLIEESLSSYGVEAKVVQINVGPVVTQFGVEPGWDHKYKTVREKDESGNNVVRKKEVSKTRVKVERIASLSNDLALALSSPSIRIEAPVPGKAIVGIEVPNTTTGTVVIREVIEGRPFQKLSLRTKLPIALGNGAGGESVVADLTKMPHLLIAGATGSGKTVCLNSVIVSLLMRNTPRELQMILIDPKRVELSAYNSVPHLAMPVIVDNDKAVAVLKWLNREMDERYRRLAVTKARNIRSYNEIKDVSPMSYLVIVIDELADLMMTGADEVESALCRLAQLSRATGIHLVVATQRPSVDVVTGLIKANFPSRISFAVASQVDSRTILDTTGAERLLGRGDMLYLPVDASKPKRLQGCLVSDQEIERVVYFWGKQQPNEERHRVFDDVDILASSALEEKSPPDPLLSEARKLAEEHGRISASYFQRKLRIGYPRAARLVDLLHDEEEKNRGVVEEEISGEDEDFSEEEFEE